MAREQDGWDARGPLGRWVSIMARLGVLVGVLVAAAACDTTDPYLATANEPQPAYYPEIKISPGDKLRITVFGEEKLTGEFDVDFNGDVSLPLGGTVRLAGLSKKAAEQVLSRKLSGQYLKDPKVTVEVTSFRPFYVIGEVERPGEFVYKNRLNIMSALAIAGGPTYRASKKVVYVQRGGIGPFEEYPLSPQIAIYPGDVIRLPERYF
jgi:protein involved in polysaccharide export with SLBB domain